MKIISRIQPFAAQLHDEVPIHQIKAGNTIQLRSPEGNTSIYQILRSTPREGLDLPYGKAMLVNLETGRVVFKPKDLKALECSGQLIVTKK